MLTSTPTSILKTSRKRSSTIAKAERSVDFSRRTRVYLVPDVSSYSQEEYDACFATEADEERNIKGIVKAITVMRTGSAADRQCEDFCDRGLEHMYSSAVAQQRKEDRNRVIDSVLDEQDDQWDAGYYDGDRLAAASQQLTSDATNLAVMRAQSDATIARRLNPVPTKMVEGSMYKSYVYSVEEESGDYRPDQSTSDLTACTTLTSSTTATGTTMSPAKRPAPSAFISSTSTPVENTLASVLSTPDFSTITGNMAIMAAQHARKRSIGSLRGLSAVASAPISTTSNSVSHHHRGLAKETGSTTLC